MNKKCLSVLLLALYFPNCNAVMPVIDGTAIFKMGQQLKAMKDQYDVLEKNYNAATSTLENAKGQLKNAESQLASVNKLKDFNSGHYKMGDFKNSLSDLQNRQWSPNKWDDALKNVAGGNPERYAQLVKAYKESHPEVSDKVMKESGATDIQIKQYKQNKEVNQAVVVQTTYAFDDINVHLKSVHELSKKIEETENTKGALDLNSRLVAEMAYIQIQTLKLQTLISQQTAQTGANTLAQTAEQVNFNQLPDDK